MRGKSCNSRNFDTTNARSSDLNTCFFSKDFASISDGYREVRTALGDNKDSSSNSLGNLKGNPMTYKNIMAAIVATLLSVTVASAEQYVVRTDQPFQGGNTELLRAMKIVEIDAFEHAGSNYIVISAPNKGYVAAYFFALHITPMEFHVLTADWTAPGLSGLSLEQRLPFLTPLTCDFCNS